MSNVVKLARRQPGRWVATCYYKIGAGVVDVEHCFEELGELERLVEHGPDWNTLDRIEIRLSGR